MQKKGIFFKSNFSTLHNIYQLFIIEYSTGIYKIPVESTAEERITFIQVYEHFNDDEKKCSINRIELLALNE